MKYGISLASTFLLLVFLLSLSGSRMAYLDSIATAQKLPDKIPESVESEIPPPVVEIYEPTSEVEETRKVTLSFLGDCLIATAGGTTHRVGSLNWMANNRPAPYFFEKVAHILMNDDFTVADSENVFTDKELEPIEKDETGFWFRSATKNALILPAGGVDMVTVANNHTGDYGKEGYADTLQALKDANLLVGESNAPVIVEKNGLRIGIICSVLWNYNYSTRIVTQIKNLETTTDIQIVYIHGGTEKVHQPDEWKQQAARRIVDAGADLVVGGHPHVLQPMEMYKGVPIVYSLGNFVYGGNRYPENRTIIYQATFEHKASSLEVSSHIIPCYVFTGSTNNWQPAPIEDQAVKDKVLDFMYGLRAEPF